MGQTGDFDISAEQPCEYRALPGFQYVNDGVDWIRESINDGAGCSCTKAVAYLGFRLISYSLIPLITNVLSLFLSLIFTIVTCGCSDWCIERLKGSAFHTARSAWDLTCDIRQVAAFLFCCDPDSPYRDI